MRQSLQQISIPVIFFFLCFSLMVSKPTPGLAVSPKISYEDSLFRSFSKADRIKKLLFQPISDFDNKPHLDSIDQLLNQHRLGGIIIGNGNIDEVKEWIEHVKKSNDNPPLFIMKIQGLLDFHFNGLSKFPEESQVELLSQDSLIIALGQTVGELSRAMGFDMIMIYTSDLYITPNFESKHKTWIKHYLKGISKTGLGVIIDNMNTQYLKQHPEMFNPTTGLVLNKGIEDDVDDLASSKSRNKFNYDRLIFRRTRDFQDWNEIFDMGNEAVILPSELSRSLIGIDYCISEKILKKRKLKSNFNAIVKLQRESISNSRPVKHIDQIVKGIPKLYHEILSGSVVSLKNEEEIIPFKNLEKSHLASITGSSKNDQIFREYLNKYTRVADYDFDFILEDEQLALTTLSHFDKIVVSINSDNKYQDQILEFLKKLNSFSKIVIIYTGSKENLNAWSAFDAVIWVPQNLEEYANLIPQNLFGALTVNGIFPFDTIDGYTNEEPILIEKSNRISYAFPEFVGVNSKHLEQVDVMVEEAISSQTIPGCQVMMIKNGTVVYEKSFGHLTYDSLQKVDNQSIYDIASITKVVATVPAIMFLEEQNEIAVNDPIGKYLPVFKNTDKSDISIQNLLRHQSGLRSHLPFWKRSEVNENGDFGYKLSKRKSIPISWNDSIAHWIASSDYNSLRVDSSVFGYLYSDLGYIVLKDLAESQLNTTLDVFLAQNIFNPLGMTSTTYDPLCQFPRAEVVPTERDSYFRKKLIRGEVNDQNAAIAEGADGHAGLFGNAIDLAKFLQMYLQEGSYGGKQYFNKETIKKFTTKLNDSRRRALGWDKPDVEVGNASKYASESSFGHTGFTGTMIWIDPKYDMIYIFLSNRTYPDAKNNKLSENNIRTKIHDIMYESFLNTKFERTNIK